MAFDKAGGFVDLLQRGGGVLVSSFSVNAYSDALVDLLSDRDKSKRIGTLGASIVHTEFSFRRYVFDLASMVDPAFFRVSVVLPNYNYARYLEERIASIDAQSYPIYELIVLDDASADNSLSVIEKSLSATPIDSQIIVNDENSGNVFKQWKKGVDQTAGDLVWIAEADDLSLPEFLDELVLSFYDGNVVLGYTQSKQIDESGDILADHYLEYVADVDKDKWKAAYVNDGVTEISESLSVKNTIPNVSGVVFRASTLKAVLMDNISELVSYSVAARAQAKLLI